DSARPRTKNSPPVPSLSGTPLCRANTRRSRRSRPLGEAGSMNRNSRPSPMMGVTGWDRGSPSAATVARYETRGGRSRQDWPKAARAGAASAKVCHWAMVPVSLSRGAVSGSDPEGGALDDGPGLVGAGEVDQGRAAAPAQVEHQLLGSAGGPPARARPPGLHLAEARRRQRHAHAPDLAQHQARRPPEHRPEGGVEVGTVA